MAVQFLRVEEAIGNMEPGEFQVLCDLVLTAEGYGRRISPGRQLRTKKTTIGTPDTSYRKDGELVFCEYTTQKSNLFQKVTSDIDKCLDYDKTSLPIEKISEIVYLTSCAALSVSEEDKITKRLESQDIRFVYYSPSALADAIYHKYPWLANETWGIKIGAEEITDFSGFLRFYDSDAAGPSLSNTYILREEEDSLEYLIETKSIVVVTGRAGTGKTKLVLEVGNRYAAKYKYGFHCVRSCQSIEYDDVLRAISKSDKNLIFFDDVNKVGGLESIVKLAVDCNAKLIVTARSYFLDDLMATLRDTLNHNYLLENVGKISIPPLSDENIKKLVEESFGIKNPSFLRQIQKLAMGNPRLAVMASETVVTQKNLGSIRDASSLYEHYYSNVVKNCFDEKARLIVAGIASILSPFDLCNSELIEALLLPFGINLSKTKIHIKKLRDLEIVDLAKDRAVAFSDQNLQVHLIKRVFFNEKYLSFSDVVITGFPTRPEAIISSVQSLLQVFGSTELWELLKKEIVAAWNYFEENASSCFLSFCKEFAIFNPEKALLSVRREIDSLETKEFAVTSLNFGDAMRSLVSDWRLAVLDNFGKGEHARDSLLVILLYYLKRPADGLQVYRAIIESFCFDPDILRYTYKRELLVVNVLIEFMHENQTENNEILFIEVAQHLLKTSVEVTRITRNHSFETLHGSLPQNTELEEYRSLIWSELSDLYSAGKHHDRIDRLLLKYGANHGRFGDAGSALIESDLKHMTKFIDANYSYEEVRHVFIVHILLEDLERIGVDVPSSTFDIFSESTYFRAIETLCPRYIREEDYFDNQARRKKELGRYIDSANEDLSNELVEICHVSEFFYIKTWEISSSLLFIVDYLKSTDNPLFLQYAERIRDNGVFIQGVFGSLVDGLIKALGVDGAFEFINVDQLNHREIWLFYYFCHVPKECINDTALKRLYLHFQTVEGLLKESPLLDIFELSKYKVIDSSVIISLSKILLERHQRNPFMLNIYFKQAIAGSKYEGKDVLKEFEGAEHVLKEIYFVLKSHSDVFDYDGQFLKTLINSNTCTITETLTRLAGDSFFVTMRDSDALDFVWNEPAYIEYANEMFEWLFENRAKIMDFEGGPLSSTPDNYSERYDEWAMQAISAYAKDPLRINVLSRIVSSLPDQKRFEYVTHYLDSNNDIEVFKEWCFFSSSMSGSPSFIPTLSKRLSFLKSLKDSIKGSNKIEHCAYITEEMRLLEEEIEENKIADFLDKFS